MTEEQKSNFNKYYSEAIKAQKGIVILDAYRTKGIGFFEKLKAKKAIKLFEKALNIYPDSYQSLFLIGKIYQRLQEYDKSLYFLEKAMLIEKENHNLPQEASLVAMHLNQINKAIEYSTEANKRKPNDFILLGNHSMNLLIAEQDQEAKNTIDKAILINPDDEINKRIKLKIENVIAGKVKRPTFKDSTK